jgi:hypothetical protein
MLGQQKFTYLIPGFLKGLPSVFNHAVGLRFYSLSPCLRFYVKPKDGCNFATVLAFLSAQPSALYFILQSLRVHRKAELTVYFFPRVLKFLGAAIKGCCRPNIPIVLTVGIKKRSEIICGVPIVKGFYLSFLINNSVRCDGCNLNSKPRLLLNWWSRTV